MASSDTVNDPNLVAVLQAADTARLQCEQILSLIASQKSTITTTGGATNEADDAESDVKTQKLDVQNKRLLSQLAIIRGLNRRAILDTRRTKQETADARQEVDTLHLQLQNLYYEQRHLRGEIAGCEGYDHTYQKLPLLDTAVFLEHFPEHAELDEHSLMRVRIDHEHADRVALEEARQSLLKRKQTLIAENNKRKEVVTALDKKIEDWIEGSERVDEEFATCAEEMGKLGAKVVVSAAAS